MIKVEICISDDHKIHNRPRSKWWNNYKRNVEVPTKFKSLFEFKTKKEAEAFKDWMNETNNGS